MPDIDLSRNQWRDTPYGYNVDGNALYNHREHPFVCACPPGVEPGGNGCSMYTSQHPRVTRWWLPIETPTGYFVRDEAGRRWFPAPTTLQEILRHKDPARYAMEMCRALPQSGRWYGS